jgi:GH15 family glucan-1,4-alpha-glucosidase
MTRPIEDYALVGDMHTVALVSKTGAIDWLCFPRFDSAACFAALLGTEDNGHWTIAPRTPPGSTEVPEVTSRRYRGDSLVLESEWQTPTGTVRVIDFMPPRDDLPDLVRVVEGVSGHVDLRSTLRVRFDYGQIVPWVHRDNGALGAIAGPDAIWFRSPVETEGRDFTTYADFTVRAGERLGFSITWSQSHLPPPRALDAHKALVDTERFWAQWMKDCTYAGEWREPVVRSLITLKALTYAPTGGIVAAATTSLPEQLGGSRNWDYRYCWLRDSTMTLHALIQGGYRAEAKAWREWLVRAIAGDPKDMQIMYGVAGERRLTEYELGWLPGYADSTPVRVGNAAADQLQLDVYGEVMDSLEFSRAAGAPPGGQVWSIQRHIMDYLEGNWQQPDNGIWEIRGERQHFTHSKVMAWVAVDRAISGVENWHLDGPDEKWRALRDEIHADVLAHGYDADRGTFVQRYGSGDLDAALLLIPAVGFLPPNDLRVTGTIDAITRELMTDGFVRRYQTTATASVDGIAGDEGAFLMCTFWLADALCLNGRREDALTLYERLLSLRNDVGLLAEEYDVTRSRQIGNLPQAFSHVAVVNTAGNLTGSGPAHHRADRSPRGGHRTLRHPFAGEPRVPLE